MIRPVWTPILLFMLPQIAGMTGVHLHIQLLVEMWSCELLPRLALNCYSSDLHLPSC
jgi:hypothetical protein